MKSYQFCEALVMLLQSVSFFLRHQTPPVLLCFCQVDFRECLAAITNRSSTAMQIISRRPILSGCKRKNGTVLCHYTLNDTIHGTVLCHYPLQWHSTVSLHSRMTQYMAQ
jgi:hypothetical protein